MAWMLQTSEEEHIRCDVDRVVRGQEAEVKEE